MADIENKSLKRHIMVHVDDLIHLGRNKRCHSYDIINKQLGWPIPNKIPGGLIKTRQHFLREKSADGFNKSQTTA